MTVSRHSETVPQDSHLREDPDVHGPEGPPKHGEYSPRLGECLLFQKY